jgi:hypothetical protein
MLLEIVPVPQIIAPSASRSSRASETASVAHKPGESFALILVPQVETIIP